MKRNRKLKNFIIKGNIQFKVALTNILHVFLVTIITVTILLSPYIYDMFQAPDVETQYRAASIFIDLLGRLSFALVLVVVLIFIHQLLITHSICGPLVNFTNTFTRMAVGDFSRKIQLRKHDFLKEEAEQVNSVMEHLSVLINDMRQNSKDLLIKLEVFEKETSNCEENPDFETAMQEAMVKLRDLDRKLQQFKLN